jgi:hypothetical protein
VAALEPAFAASLLQRRRLRDQEHAAIGRFEYQQWRRAQLVRCRAGHPTTDLRAGLEAHERAQRAGIGDREVAAREALLHVAENLDLAKRGAMLGSETPGLGAGLCSEPVRMDCR